MTLAYANGDGTQMRVALQPADTKIQVWFAKSVIVILGRFTQGRTPYYNRHYTKATVSGTKGHLALDGQCTDTQGPQLRSVVRRFLSTH